MSAPKPQRQESLTLLHEAMNQFKTTSYGLEHTYQLLEEQVRCLNQELEEKNQALRSSILEKEEFRERVERNHRLVAVGEMAARMAHELRNPLGSIELFASLLREEFSPGSEKRQWVLHLSTAVKAMDYVISNLLCFTRQPIPHFRKVYLDKVLEDAVRFASHLIQQNGIQTVVKIDTPKERVDCDEDLLRQIFLNLILNAVDAMPQGGLLEVTATHDPQDKVIVTIRDNGVGIPVEVLPRIFDPFFTTKGKGAGLGLAIVHNAVAAHQGIIQVQSEVGKGTCFTFTFNSCRVATVLKILPEEKVA